MSTAGDPGAAASPAEPTAPDALMLIVRRSFDAPAERVFDAWLDPSAAERWLFATPGGEMVRGKMDPRVGGTFVVVERRGGVLAEHFGRYLELARPRRLVFSFATAREQQPARVTVAIAPAGAGCELTLTHEMNVQWAPHADRTRAGWTDILEGLASTLAGDREIVLSRFFGAPRAAVYRAWTDPAQVGRWWGPRGFTTTIHEMEVRAGGRWRYTMHGPDGTDYPNRIAYREVVEPERLVYSHGEDVDGDPGAFRVRVAFTDEGGGTRVTMRSIFSSAAERDAVVGFGAVELGKQSLECLAEHLAAR